MAKNITRLLVGDEGCTCQEIARIFDNQSINTLKINWWTTLAIYLDIPGDCVEKWREDLRLEKITDNYVIIKCLEEWRHIKGNDATLRALHAAIPVDKRQLKDYIQDKIREKANRWNDLDTDSQNVVRQTKIQFLGRTYSFSSIQNMITEEKFEALMNKIEMKDFFLKSFQNEDWDLGHYEIPQPLSYYVHRTLTLRRKLNPAVFKHKCDDIFLFEGIQRHRLTILANPEPTDISASQTQEVTRRFILLEHPDDLNDITTIANYPVHRIRHKDNQFYWISTSGSCEMIRVFLYNDFEEFDETTLINSHLSNFNNRPIAICSSPGMGKSVFLANLVREMIQNYPNRIGLYLELRSLMDKRSCFGQEIGNSDIFKQMLISSTSSCILGENILLECLQNKNISFEIFLDGFDEISLANLQFAKMFIKWLQEFYNMRIYITSRPHMRHHIENILGVISLDIAPFNRKNQMDFLSNFWKLNERITNKEKLSQFALKVLECLEFIDRDRTFQNEYAGNPLHCYMLGQVYMNHAKMFSNRPHFTFQITNSLYQLYAKFINTKFENIQECERNMMKGYHWKEALNLLFPGNKEATQIIQQLETKTNNTKYDADPEKIFSVGIMERKNNKSTFVHRTFAEYLLAEFIVEELLVNEEFDINISVKFIIDSVLFVHNTKEGYIILGHILMLQNTKFLHRAPTTLSLELQRGHFVVPDGNFKPTIRDYNYAKRVPLVLNNMLKFTTSKYRVILWSGVLVSDDDIRRICRCIETSEDWSNKKLTLEKLRLVLLSQCDTPPEKNEFDLQLTLLIWVSKLGANATIEMLGRALCHFGCRKLVDDLYKNVIHGKNVLQNTMICIFLDGALRKHEKSSAEKKSKYRVCDSLDVPPDQSFFAGRLCQCIENGYQFLTQSLVKWYHELSIFTNVIKLDSKLCRRMLVYCTLNDNVELFAFICDKIVPFKGLEFQELFKWKVETKNYITYHPSPLFQAVCKGNYNLTADLVYKIDINDMGDLWHKCFRLNWKDSPNVINNKVNILQLLKELHQNIQVKEVEELNRHGTNLVLLTSLYDICDYVPSEKDVPYIMKCIYPRCSNDSEIDILVNWLLSKKLGHILTHEYEANCLLTVALYADVLKSETLSLVYRQHSFNLGILLDYAVSCKRSEALVKTIVELSGDVNLRDEKENTFLHWASYYLKLNVIKYLLSIHTVNVNARDMWGNNPLHCVFQYKECTDSYHLIHDIVYLLVINHADVCAENISGISALQLAEARKTKLYIEDMTTELLKRAVRRPETNIGQLSVALFKKFATSSNPLDNRTITTTFIDAIECKQFSIFVKNIVRISENIILANAHNTTLLHNAALYLEQEAIKYLLSNGADSNSTDNDGDTPLHYIFDWDSKNDLMVLFSIKTNYKEIHECVLLLLKYNADVSVKNKKGENPLDCALQQKKNLNIEDRTINLLIERLQLENEVD